MKMFEAPIHRICSKRREALAIGIGICIGLILVACMLPFTNYGNRKQHAICSAITSTGEVCSIRTTEDIHEAFDNAIHVYAPEGEDVSVYVTLICPDCDAGFWYEGNTANPETYLLQCDCGDKLFENDELAYVTVGIGDSFIGIPDFE